MYKVLIRLKRLIKRFLKVKAETRQLPTTRTSSKINKYLMVLLVSAAIAFLYPVENFLRPFDFPRKGEISQKDILAPLQFTMLKTSDELREEKESAANAIPTIIECDTVIVDSTLQNFDRFMSRGRQVAGIIDSLMKSQRLPPQTLDSIVDSLKQTYMLEFPSIRPATFEKLLKNQSINFTKSIIEDILKNQIYYTGVLPDRSGLPEAKNRSVIVRIGNREIFMVRDKLLDLSLAYVNLLAALNNRYLIDSFNVDEYYEYGRDFIVPNLTVNIEEMNTRRLNAMNEISDTSEVVAVGDVIVRAGSQVTPRQEKILEEMYRQEKALSEEKNWLTPLIPAVVRFLLIIACFLALYLYLYYFQQKIYMSNPKLLALFFVYGLELILIYFIGLRWDLSIYLYPVAIFAILITVLFDAEVGTFNIFILALLLGILQRFNFSISLIAVIVGLVSCYSIQKVRHRSDFFKAVLYLLLTYTAMIFILESFKVVQGEKLLNLLGFGWANAVLSPLLAMGILPVFESLFGFTTNITLLELSDLNNPLLKRLALEAPGTFHHSFQIGNLVEAAAKAIDANPLLARVGAYYHDIGKMEIPEYFVENQLGIKSKHESLTPTMSAIVLVSHLKKGRQIGEEADIPDEVLNFIEEHHGTMIMTYFYNKAKEMGVANPPEDEFRYPGPKPQTRETAIVMLADSVEAASRTLTDPKPARIRNLVQNIINDRFQSGELEECPLTLKDLAMIRESFTQVLIGAFHHRIEYPDKDEKK
ncbi:MAG: hypothetical protein CVT49_02045 [candidate division Zixibacteria bacterium HGW-Zixibacteria-1]|nr:MAG: hypothetical protein CVT49_02045 [candidate division Zixibacteria bacterium HGW-Zixibacteria-1]